MRGEKLAFDLAALQRWMQAVVTHPAGIEPGLAAPIARDEIPEANENLERVIRPSQSLSAADRMAIYSSAYFARLLECLREQFPALRFTLQNQAFDLLAVSYLEQHPSASYSLNDLARNFVPFLERTRPTDEGAGNPWADFTIDLARLEATIDEVFDGPGEEDESPRIAERLAKLLPEEWPRLRLKVSRSLRLLELRHPLDAYYSAARAGEDHPLPKPEPSYLVVWRKHYVVRRWSILRAPFLLLRELAAGAPLAESLEVAMSKSADPAAFAAQIPEWFHDWGIAGLIVDAEI